MRHASSGDTPPAPWGALDMACMGKADDARLTSGRRNKSTDVANGVAAVAVVPVILALGPEGLGPTLAAERSTFPGAVAADADTDTETGDEAEDGGTRRTR